MFGHVVPSKAILSRTSSDQRSELFSDGNGRENGYPYFAPRTAPLVQKAYVVNADPRAFEGRGKLPPGATAIVSNKGDANIAKLNVDTVMMVDVLRLLPGFGPDSDQPQDRSSYYQGILAGLKPGGRLVIIDSKLPATFPLAQRRLDAVLADELPLVGFGSPQQFTILQYQYVARNRGSKSLFASTQCFGSPSIRGLRQTGESPETAPAIWQP
jgi:hypothetical protein